MTWQPREGDVIAGKYRIEKILGAGGMGVVLAASHVELNQRVAVKLMHPELAQSSEAVGRFIREGQAAVRLSSPHAARVFDVGRVESGAPYLVMEYLEGKDLAAVVQQRGPLPLGEVLSYLLQACEALAEAHAVGIVHRDLKPANLFATTDPYGNASVKVLDFGISKLTPGHSSVEASQASVTATSVVMGSPLYMPPEQMRSARSADARSDIWALGTILYELLAGKPAWSGETMSEVFVRVATDPAPKVCTARTELPPEIDAILERCLQKDPALRFQSVVEFAQALAPLLGAAGKAALTRIIRLSGIGAGVCDTPNTSNTGDSRADLALAQARTGAVGKSSTAGSSVGTAVGWGTHETAPPRQGARAGTRLLLLAAGAVVVLLSVAGGMWWQGSRGYAGRAALEHDPAPESKPSGQVVAAALPPPSTVATIVIDPYIAASATLKPETPTNQGTPPKPKPRAQAQSTSKARNPKDVAPAPVPTRSTAFSPPMTPDWGGRQ